MPITSVEEQPDRYQIGFQVDLGDEVIVGIFTMNLERGASGLAEADMDEAVQNVVDHLATLPTLATGSLTATKANVHAFAITPTEE